MSDDRFVSDDCCHPVGVVDTNPVFSQVPLWIPVELVPGDDFDLPMQLVSLSDSGVETPLDLVANTLSAMVDGVDEPLGITISDLASASFVVHFPQELTAVLKAGDHPMYRLVLEGPGGYRQTIGRGSIILSTGGCS